MEDVGSGRGRLQLWCKLSPAPSGDLISSCEATMVTLLLLWANISSTFCKISYWILFVREGHDIESRVLCSWGWRWWELMWYQPEWRTWCVPGYSLSATRLINVKAVREFWLLWGNAPSHMLSHVTARGAASKSPEHSLGLSLGSCDWALWTSCEINIFDNPEIA